MVMDLPRLRGRCYIFLVCSPVFHEPITNSPSMGAFNDPLAWTTASLGGMPAAVEVKLVDVPELNYLSSQDPPKGEIWIRGDAVIEGYLENPKENSQAFREGWFKTGDIGLFDATGQLKIIDRKKNLIKTLNGEYIALEKLESMYRSAPVVNNICVYASPEHARPIAIVEPAAPALGEIAKRVGEEDVPHKKLCTSDKVRAAVLVELLAVGKQSGLQGIELIQSIVLSEYEWTPQNGLVTNAQKLNRRAVVEKFRKQIDSLH
jgi:long-chain acyl-CoA synthetase